MPNAVVGLLRSVLTLDNKDFEANAKKSTATANAFTTAIKGVGQETLRAGSAVDRMAASLGGTKLLQTANNLTAAVEKLGGVSRLTEAEQARLNTTLDKAIKKYEALGQQAPAAMQSLHQATMKPVAATSILDTAVGKLGATMAATFSVGAVVGFAKSIGSFAGQMMDLSAETQVGVERLQAWNFVLTGAGVKVDEWAASLQQLSKRLASGDDSAVKAVERLGLSVEELLRLGPEEAFLQIGQAVAGIENPMERTRTAMELFGRSGSRMLRIMTDDMRAVVDAAEKSGAVISKELIEAADRFDDAWQQAILRVKAGLVNLAGVVVKAMNSVPTGAGPGSFATAKAGGGFSGPLAPVESRVTSGFSFLLGAPTGITGTDVGARLRDQTRDTRELARVTGSDLVSSYRMATASADAYIARTQDAIGASLRMFATVAGASGRGLTRRTLAGMDEAGNIASGAITPRKVVGPGGLFEAMPFGITGGVSRATGGGGFLSGLTGGFANVFQGMTGGKGISGFFGNIGGGISQGIGNMISGGLTSLISGGLGLAVSGIGKLFGSLFGGGEKKKTQEARTKGLEQFGGAEAFKAMAREAGVAEATINRVFSATRVRDYEAALKAVTTQIEAHNQLLKDQQSLTDAQTKRQQMLNDAVERYGFTTEELGPKLRKQRLAEQAEEILTDWQLLEEAGFDINTMAKRMADSVNGFLATALKTGTQVPIAMRPILESMLRQGLLTDANGEKLEDLTQINFGDELVDQFERVLEKLDILIQKLIDATQPRTVRVTTVFDSQGNPAPGPPGGGGDGGDPQNPSFHRGGIVAHMGRFLGTGSGEVMVRALRGEAFLNRSATSAIGGKSMVDAINAGDWRSVFDGFAGLSGSMTPAMAGGADFGGTSFGLSNSGIESRLDELNGRLTSVNGRVLSIISTLPMHIEAAVQRGKAR